MRLPGSVSSSPLPITVTPLITEEENIVHFMSFPRFFFRHWLTHKPSYLILHVTSRCNLSCRTCFLRAAHHEPELGFFASLANSLPELMWLDIGGGEPFLRDDLPELCGLFRTKILSIPTNGWDSDRVCRTVGKIRKRFHGKLILSISIDGPKDMHDRLRASGSWERAWDTFRNVRAMDGIAVKINTVICEENIDTLPDFLPWVRSQGPDAHSLILLRGDPNDPSLRLPSLERLKSCLPIILHELKQYSYGSGPLARRLLAGYHRLLWETSLAILEQKRQVIPCLGGSNHIVVWADKRAGSCEMLEPPGSLADSSLPELLGDPAWKAQRRFIAGGGCWCTHNCALLSSLFFHPPSLLKLLWRTARG